MPTLEITCIVKPDPQSQHERIERVGGVNFSYSLDEAVALVQSGQATFVVRAPGLQGLFGALSATVLVQVRSIPGHKPFLQTVADGYYSDNLLSLPQCGGLMGVMFRPGS